MHKLSLFILLASCCCAALGHHNPAAAAGPPPSRLSQQPHKFIHFPQRKLVSRWMILPSDSVYKDIVQKANEAIDAYQQNKRIHPENTMNKYRQICRSLEMALTSSHGGYWLCFSGQIDQIGSWINVATIRYAHFTLDDLEFVVFTADPLNCPDCPSDSADLKSAITGLMKSLQKQKNEITGIQRQREQCEKQRAQLLSETSGKSSIPSGTNESECRIPAIGFKETPGSAVETASQKQRQPDDIEKASAISMDCQKRLEELKRKKADGTIQRLERRVALEKKEKEIKILRESQKECDQSLRENESLRSGIAAVSAQYEQCKADLGNLESSSGVVTSVTDFDVVKRSSGLHEVPIRFRRQGSTPLTTGGKVSLDQPLTGVCTEDVENLQNQVFETEVENSATERMLKEIEDEIIVLKRNQEGCEAILSENAKLRKDIAAATLMRDDCKTRLIAREAVLLHLQSDHLGGTANIETSAKPVFGELKFDPGNAADVASCAEEIKKLQIKKEQAMVQLLHKQGVLKEKEDEIQNLRENQKDCDQSFGENQSLRRGIAAVISLRDQCNQELSKLGEGLVEGEFVEGKSTAPVTAERSFERRPITRVLRILGKRSTNLNRNIRNRDQCAEGLSKIEAELVTFLGGDGLPTTEKRRLIQRTLSRDHMNRSTRSTSLNRSFVNHSMRSTSKPHRIRAARDTASTGNCVKDLEQLRGEVLEAEVKMSFTERVLNEMDNQIKVLKDNQAGCDKLFSENRSLRKDIADARRQRDECKSESIKTEAVLLELQAGRQGSGPT
ncbi:unnamed protein product [Cyprideis torosa]|uniref:Uncharacterized protein n=1 Tax=Cyprideis torosa TaxID=163714 RepID=A0A7R8WTW4_9CRUS|nr:unnamed protein product [Cyprideis torosa]CAG0905080.1 unnamed protein product [Cyprideis torosa]